MGPAGWFINAWKREEPAADAILQMMDIDGFDSSRWREECRKAVGDEVRMNRNGRSCEDEVLVEDDIEDRFRGELSVPNLKFQSAVCSSQLLNHRARL